VDDETTLGLLSMLDDESTRQSVIAERAFLSGLGGGCAVPVAAYAETVMQPEVPGIRLTGLVISEDGETAIKVTGEGIDPLQLGEELAREAIAQGAGTILAASNVK
jgi:hydroxymethylbilane synthase